MISKSLYLLKASPLLKKKSIWFYHHIVRRQIFSKTLTHLSHLPLWPLGWFCLLNHGNYMKTSGSSLAPSLSAAVIHFSLYSHEIFSVEKVAVLCRFLDIGAVTKNHLLKYALAHAFCCFLASVEDVNPAVATRARLLLDTIKRPSLQVLCSCF